MSLDELKGRAVVTGEVGDKLDEMYSASEKEIVVLHGKALGAHEAAKAISTLHDHIRKDKEDGTLPTSFSTPEEMASFLNKWIIRAYELASNISEKAKSEKLVAQGRNVALRQSLEVVKRYHVNAVNQANNALAAAEAEAAGVPEEEETTAKTRRKRRKAGESPGISPLDERRTAARKRKTNAT